MIICDLKNSETYNSLHPQFKKAFDFLKTIKLDNSNETYKLEGENLFGGSFSAESNNKENITIETHKKHIDIHFTIQGTDLMGWSDNSNENITITETKEESDCTFYKGELNTWVPLQTGSLAICYPEDIHAPLCGEGKVTKIVLKVKV
jgi:biofilm protein TabA